MVHTVIPPDDPVVDLRILATIIALVAAMVIAAFLGRRQRAGAAILVLVSLAWLTVDRDFEGPLLLKLNDEHGIVLSDLVGFLGLGVGVWLWFRAR